MFGYVWNKFWMKQTAVDRVHPARTENKAAKKQIYLFVQAFMIIYLEVW